MMKLVSVKENGSIRLGIEIDGKAADAAASYERLLNEKPPRFLRRMDIFLRHGERAMDAARRVEEAARQHPGDAVWADGSLAAPVHNPPKLLCLAGNYAEHIREGGGNALEKERTTPRVFMKPPTTTIIGPGEAIRIPKTAGWIDWEAELAVVMGKRAKRVSAEKALEYVAGYTIVNDVSERALTYEQDREPREGDRWFDWLNGKWCDTFAPQGPCLTTADAIPDPDGLDIRLSVNGVVKQDANTNQMIYSCAELIEWTSRLIALEPGDVIATGTPAGVGRPQGERLHSGDVVEIFVEKIGTLTNPVLDEE